MLFKYWQKFFIELINYFLLETNTSRNLDIEHRKTKFSWGEAKAQTIDQTKWCAVVKALCSTWS